MDLKEKGVYLVELVVVEVLPINDAYFPKVTGKRQNHLAYRGTILEPRDITYIQEFEKLYGFNYYLGQYEEMEPKRRQFIEEATIERIEAFLRKYPSVWDKRIPWGNFFNSLQNGKRSAPVSPSRCR